MTFVLRQLLESAADQPLPEWDRVTTHIRELGFPAGATVFHQDVQHPYLYAVREGLIKLCYLDESGNEWIKSFAEEGRYFASITALEPRGKTSFATVAMEKSRLERLDFPLVEELANRHLAWGRAMQRLTMAFAARKEARERSLLTLSPENRYRAFLAECPALEKRIPQNNLARYLGLTPVGLNRIVSRVRSGAG